MDTHESPSEQASDQPSPVSEGSEADAFDEVLEGPGYFFGRKGRFLVQKNDFSPEQQAAIQAHVVARIPATLKEQDERIAGLEQIIREYHPLDLLANLSFANSVLDGDSYKEYEFEGSSAYVEYVTLLYLVQLPEALAWTADRIPDGPTIEKIQELLGEVFRAEMILLVSRQVQELGGRQPDAWDELRFRTISDSIKVRYPGYQHHLIEHLRGLAQATDSFVGDALGWSISDALALAPAVLSLMTRRLAARREDAKHLAAELRQALDNRADEPVQAPRELDELLRQFRQVPEEHLDSALQNYVMFATFHGLGETFSFSAEDLASEAEIPHERAAAFLESLSLSFGDPINARYRRPAPTHPLALRPFVRRGDQYFCPVVQMIEWSIRPAIESLLKPGAPDCVTTDPRYWERYESARSRFLEARSLELLAGALRSARVHANLKYRTKRDDGTTVQAELDGLILFDNTAFLVECKAGSLSPPARRGAQARMKEEMKELTLQRSGQLLIRK